MPARLNKRVANVCTAGGLLKAKDLQKLNDRDRDALRSDNAPATGLHQNRH
jgi:hypothetical protein